MKVFFLCKVGLITENHDLKLSSLFLFFVLESEIQIGPFLTKNEEWLKKSSNIKMSIGRISTINPSYLSKFDMLLQQKISIPIKNVSIANLFQVKGTFRLSLQFFSTFSFKNSSIVLLSVSLDKKSSLLEKLQKILRKFFWIWIFYLFM